MWMPVSIIFLLQCPILQESNNKPTETSTSPAVIPQFAASSTSREISISDPNVNITGIECIWHNVYEDSDFRTMRKWYDDGDTNALLLFVANHVRQNLYTIVAICATKHMFVITCACEKNSADLPDGWFIME